MREGSDLSESTIAKLFQNGRSQAVRLPREFRFHGDRVRVRRLGRGVVLEPLVIDDVPAWFAEMDRMGDESLLNDQRHQPSTPVDAVDLD
jgi:antitoxin VapB